MRLLVATVDAGGNTQPTVGVVRELIRRGHEVQVLGHPSQRDRYGAMTDFEPWRSARAWDPRPPQPGLRSMLGWLALASDPGFGKDVVTRARSRPPDVVLVDCMIPATLRPARQLGRPVVMLAHAFSGYWHRQWTGVRPMNVWLHAAGAHPADARATPDLVVLTTQPTFDQPERLRVQLNSRLSQTGPILPEVTVAAAAPNGNAPVLVSLSTLAYPGQRQCLQRIFDALGELGVPAIATLGPAVSRSGLRVPANVTTLDYAEHRDVMPGCAAVISHGGHGTTMTALAHGLPVMVVPMSPHADQPLVARAVNAAGAGMWSSRESGVPQLRVAIDRLVGDHGLRRAAQAIGAQLRACPGAGGAATAIERAGDPPA